MSTLFIALIPTKLTLFSGAAPQAVLFRVALMKLVLVEWLDSHAGRGWQDFERIEEAAEPLHCRSVGWLAAGSSRLQGAGAAHLWRTERHGGATRVWRYDQTSPLWRYSPGSLLSSGVYYFIAMVSSTREEANPLQTEAALAALSVALGAEETGDLVKEEARLLTGAPTLPQDFVRKIKARIQANGDPLGDAFCAIRTAAERRTTGAIYTPKQIVTSMFDWAASVGVPARVIEPGAGSGRFLMEAARRFPKAELIAVESDPLASLMARANLSVIGKAKQASVILADFRRARVAEIEGRTLYIGNPPYVRHHLIESRWKGTWLKIQAKQLGIRASDALAGLHVYFFMAIAWRSPLATRRPCGLISPASRRSRKARWSKDSDYGALITAAEWLDVNYGQIVRDLFLNRLGGQSVFVYDTPQIIFWNAAKASSLEPHTEPFPARQRLELSQHSR